MPLILTSVPRVIRAGREYPLELPLRSDPRWGLHVVQPLRHGLPVGSGQPSDGDPTIDFQWGEVPVLRPPLPYPGEPCITSVLDCNHANQYTFAMAGMANNGAFTCCPQFNRVWTLTWVPASNFWLEIATTCAGQNVSVVLFRNLAGTPSNRLSFQVHGGTRASYDADCMNCEGGTVMTLLSTPTTCTGWPATITVTKV